AFPPFTSATTRNPSHFVSKTQAGSSKSWSVRVASMGRRSYGISVRSRVFPNRKVSRVAFRGSLFVTQLAPIRFVNLHAIVLGSLLDVGEGKVALGIGHILDLIKACECISDMVRVGQWLLTLTRKSEHTLG